jgi:hypothetical protein
MSQERDQKPFGGSGAGGGGGGEGRTENSALTAIEHLTEKWTQPQRQWLVWKNDEGFARRVFINPPPTTPDPTDLSAVQQLVNALSPADKLELLRRTAHHSK